MRVVSGKYKSLKLNTLKSNDTRPTTDKVRENLFNILGEVNGDCLDLFAGSGALGIEALSRGAQSAIFVDGAIDAVKLIHNNLKEVSEHTQVFRNDYKRALKALHKREKQFDLIFLDPPYHKALANQALKLIEEYALIKNDGRIVVESHKDELIDTLNFSTITDRTYGTIRIQVLGVE